MKNEWIGFVKGNWVNQIDVRDFINKNIKPYDGDEGFLNGKSLKTDKVWKKCESLLKKEAISGVLDVETDIIAGIDNFEPGYIDRKNEVIVGLQTDEALKRIINPYGGMRMVKKSLEQYGFRMDKDLHDKFVEFRKTHNDGVFDAYTKDIRKARTNHLITGLPDAYGRGRIIGDYRRMALYGADYIIAKKEEDLDKLASTINNSVIRLREEVREQIKALKETVKMASRYGYDISKPATSAKEAVQWLYFAYLAAVKQNNGAATSIGRNTTFIEDLFVTCVLLNMMSYLLEIRLGLQSLLVVCLIMINH